MRGLCSAGVGCAGVLVVLAAARRRASACSPAQWCRVMVQGGASGSPVFRLDTGAVIGVIESRRFEVLGASPGSASDQLLPTNFSYVVPSHYVRVLLDSGPPLPPLPPDAPDLSSIEWRMGAKDIRTEAIFPWKHTDE